jgi:hypothetical protein
MGSVFVYPWCLAPGPVCLSSPTSPPTGRLLKNEAPTKITKTQAGKDLFHISWILIRVMVRLAHDVNGSDSESSDFCQVKRAH